MPWRKCLTDEEEVIKGRMIAKYNQQKLNANGWGDNSEVVAFYYHRLQKEVERLRNLLIACGGDPGSELDWLALPLVGPDTNRPGHLANPKKR